MDVGRIGARTLPVDAGPEEIGALVERERTAFAGGGKHAAVVDLPADLPTVIADGRRVVQVLDNLLANAVWHTGHRSPGAGDPVRGSSSARGWCRRTEGASGQSAPGWGTRAGSAP